MVIPAPARPRELALRETGAAELAAPDHERVFEQTALLEILHEPGRRLIDFTHALAVEHRMCAVVVPGVVVELDELDVALG
jgi:hypothetical protein